MWPRGMAPIPSVEAPRAGVRPLLDGARPRGLGREVGEEVSGTARRGPGGARIGTLGREPELRENPADDPGVLNGHDEPHVAATALPRRGWLHAF